MRKKRVLSVITAFAVMFCLAGCQKDTNAGQAEQTSGEVAEMKTIEPPEDGWTLEKLLDVTYLYSHQFKSPCTLNTLGSDFNFDNEFFSLHKEDNGASVMLQYKGTTIASVGLKDCRDQDTVSNDTEIYRMFFTLLYGDDNVNNIAVNGITFYSSKEDVISRLGMPDVDMGHTVTYYKPDTEESLLSLGINEDNEVKSIHITLTGQSEPTSVEVAEIKTIDPPEDGWTLDELMNVTYIYGNTINLPCALNDLPPEFTCDKTDSLYFEEANYLSVTLNYNDEFIGSIGLQNCATPDDISEQSVVDRLFISDWANDKNKDNIFVNGLLLDDDYESVVEKLGLPDITEDYSLTYCDKNTGSEMLSIALSDEKKILGILFFVK